jgi:hypothetical protein
MEVTFTGSPATTALLCLTKALKLLVLPIFGDETFPPAFGCLRRTDCWHSAIAGEILQPAGRCVDMRALRSPGAHRGLLAGLVIGGSALGSASVQPNWR